MKCEIVLTQRVRAMEPAAVDASFTVAPYPLHLRMMNECLIVEGAAINDIRDDILRDLKYDHENSTYGIVPGYGFYVENQYQMVIDLDNLNDVFKPKT